MFIVYASSHVFIFYNFLRFLLTRCLVVWCVGFLPAVLFCRRRVSTDHTVNLEYELFENLSKKKKRFIISVNVNQTNNRLFFNQHEKNYQSFNAIIPCSRFDEQISYNLLYLHDFLERCMGTYIICITSIKPIKFEFLHFDHGERLWFMVGIRCNVM